jgi:hypothetical protein
VDQAADSTETAWQHRSILATWMTCIQFLVWIKVGSEWDDVPPTKENPPKKKHQECGASHGGVSSKSRFLHHIATLIHQKHGDLSGDSVTNLRLYNSCKVHFFLGLPIFPEPAQNSSMFTYHDVVLSTENCLGAKLAKSSSHPFHLSYLWKNPSSSEASHF